MTAEQSLLMEELYAKKIVVGRSTYHPKRIRQRAVSLIALKSRHVVLDIDQPHQYDEFNMLLTGKEQNEVNNDEVALGELENYGQLLLCIEICRFSE